MDSYWGGGGGDKTLDDDLDDYMGASKGDSKDAAAKAPAAEAAPAAAAPAAAE